MNAPWEQLTAKQQKVILHGVKGKMTVKYKNRYGRSRSYSTEYEGVIPWIKRRHEGSDSDWAREQYEGYMRLVALHVVQRCAAQAVDAGGHDRGQAHLRGVRHADRRVGEVPRRARTLRARAVDRRAGDQGDQRPARLPARRRPRLPHAVTRGRALWRAARRSASGSPRRSARGWSARSTCSTSRRSGCTSATTDA